MSLIKCDECGKEISDKATTCPNCGCPVQQITTKIQPNPPIVKKRGHGCLIPVLIVFLLLCIGISAGISQSAKSNSTNDNSLSLILDANTYARISTNELIALLGNPKSTEEWNNETSKGTFLMKIHTFDLDGMYSEFITYEDVVVKIRCFSNDKWKVKKKFDNIFKLFNITLSENAKKIVDTGATYKFSPVSETVAKFEVYNFDNNDHTFDTVYITYNLNYFDD